MIYKKVVKKVGEAHGGYCAMCGLSFDIARCPYWHWTKSVAMHRRGTGHEVVLWAYRSEGAVSDGEGAAIALLIMVILILVLVIENGGPA